MSWRSSIRTVGRPAARAVLVALAVALLGTACTGDEAPEIITAEVGTADVTEVVEAPATVEAKASATLTSPADGTVATLEVTDGQQVQVGQVLLRIDSPAAQEQLAQARAADADAASAGDISIPGADLSAESQAADEAAAAGFASARDAAARIPDLTLQAQALATVAHAEAQYAAARAQARASVERFNAGLDSLADALGSLSEAQRVQTRAAVVIAERNVAALTLTAPLAGTVSFGGGAAGDAGASAGDVSQLLGDLPSEAQGQASQLLGGDAGGALARGQLAVGLPVSVGDPLLSVVDVSALTLIAEVDETDILLVQPGVPAQIELDAVPGASYTATVSSIDLAPTTSARGGVSYRVRLTLGVGTTGDGATAPPPRPGMSAVADLRVRTAENAVAVPAAAVVRDGQQDAVWVVEGDQAERRPVRLGAQGEANVEVVDGLEVGDRIVVRGADRVTEGQEIP